jgi:hypothetical protein
MLVQRREHVFRLIRQHDHALLAGALAFAWRLDHGGTLSMNTALATALHDVVWRDEDQRPRLNPDAGAPHDFVSIPPRVKQAFIQRGVEHIDALDTEVAHLIAAHHRTLADGTPVEPDSELAWLRFFDNLSLFVCLTPPGSLSELHPRWLGSPLRIPPRGAVLSLRWTRADELTLEPFPFGARFSVSLPYRDLPSGTYDEEGLARAWSRSAEARWTVSLSTPS